MSDYIKKLIQDRTDAVEAEKAAVVHLGNLPVLTRHNMKLTELQETIVKATYLTGGMYVADIKMMMAFSAEVQSVERSIKDLITDGYLNKIKNVYGVLLGLTKDAVSQIKQHPEHLPDGLEVNVQEMDISGENAYMKHRCISYAVADYVFYKRLESLWNKFYTTDKYVRNFYLCKQYLKQLVYRDFLNMTKNNREQFLTDTGFTDDEKALFIDNEKFIIWNASKFAELYFLKVGFENIKTTENYHQYIQIIKREALKEPNFNTFCLLKDMLADEEKQGYQELKLLWSWKTTMLKFGMDKLRTGIKGTESLIISEKKLDSCNRYLSVLQNERRSLINSNAYKKKTDEKQLGEAVIKLAELDYAISSIRKEKEKLETDFSFSVLKGYDGCENDYELKVINLMRLYQNCVYLSAKSEKEICMYVIQSNEEYFDLFSLHKKMAMGIQLVRRLAPYTSITVKIFSYSASQQEFIEQIFPALKKKLLESKETAFFGNQIEDICSLHRAQDSLKERYIFFQNIKNEMEGDSYSDEEKSSNGTSEESSD